jgi:dynein light intermediate chain, axonemal
MPKSSQLFCFCVGSSKSKGTLPPLQGKPNTGNIMNAILPPREWLADEKHFI